MANRGMRIQVKRLIAAAAVALVAGCASTPQTQPTHYWQSTSNAPKNQYRMDNMACQADAQADIGATTFEPDSPSFDNYRDCMISRGYTLRQY